MERNFKIDDRILKFLTVATSGAVTREGIDAEIAEAEARRSQAQAEPQAITNVEKPAKEEKQEDEPARSDAQTEANETKGE